MNNHHDHRLNLSLLCFTWLLRSWRRSHKFVFPNDIKQSRLVETCLFSQSRPSDTLTYATHAAGTAPEQWLHAHAGSDHNTESNGSWVVQGRYRSQSWPRSFHDPPSQQTILGVDVSRLGQQDVRTAWLFPYLCLSMETIVLSASQ